MMMPAISEDSIDPLDAEVNFGKFYTNMRDYNLNRQAIIKQGDSQSLYNESNILRRSSMRSIAESIVIRDDESIELERKIMQLMEEEREGDKPMAFNELEEDSMGNVCISLMWEEKVVLALRFF
jgi:hypothetical protein